MVFLLLYIIGGLGYTILAIYTYKVHVLHRQGILVSALIW